MAEKKNLWTTYKKTDLTQLNKLAEAYKAFLSTGKTERRFVTQSIDAAEKAGFRNLDQLIAKKTTLKKGDKFYAALMGKSLILGIIGKTPMEAGMNILGAHVDSPRLDLKQVPLYEDTELAFLDTHYYGGVKKYQWVTTPLALYGVIAKKDGTVIDVAIGDDDSDPVFCFTDLLIHLSAKQLEKRASVVIEGEALDLLFGSCPAPTKKGEKEQKEAVKAGVLAILAEKYGIEEDDFLSAEIEVVPAGKARDCGIDRSMILGYGHDDRVCAYTSLAAILDQTGTPERTSLCLLVDKEEIGSVGATGMESRFFENTVAEVMELTGESSGIALRRCLANSFMLSSDVSAAYDPLYASVYEKRNCAYFGKGIVFNKYTGSRGKSGSNDASAEYMAKIRQIMDDGNVGFQTAELGKVDAGGGGTIAYIAGNYGMNVIDSGVAVLSMHAPWEVVSKSDVFEAYKCYKTFLATMK